MSHLLTPPRSDRGIAVLDMDGTPRSWHATFTAAEAAVRREIIRFWRQAGASNSYLPRTILHIPAAGAHVRRVGCASTQWRLA